MLSDYFAGRGVAQKALPGGGSVPLRFSDPAREHLTTRRGVGLFDFSFMGWWSIRGAGALPCLQRLQTRDLRTLRPGRICYTLLCREDGSVMIDATVWCHDAEHYWFFTGRRSDGAHVEMHATNFDVDVAEMAPSYGVIAIQGPASAGLLSRTLANGIDAISYFSFRHCEIDDYGAWIGRLGYTGELGYEVLVPSQHAPAVWKRLAEAPIAADRLECGMEAANSLRIEAAYIHFAYELDRSVTPAEIGLSRLVRTGGGDFIGRGALHGLRSARRRLAGVIIGASATFASANRVRDAVQVTSEAFSPIFCKLIGLGFVDADAPLAGIVYTAEGRRAQIARLPFRDPTRRLVRQSPTAAAVSALNCTSRNR